MHGSYRAVVIVLTRRRVYVGEISDLDPRANATLQTREVTTNTEGIARRREVRDVEFRSYNRL